MNRILSRYRNAFGGIAFIAVAISLMGADTRGAQSPKAPSHSAIADAVEALATCEQIVPLECPPLQLLIEAKEAGAQAIAGRLHAPDLSERIRSANALGYVGGTRSIDALGKALPTAYSAAQREAIIASLGRTGDPKALATLAPLLKGDGVALKIAVVNAIGQTGLPDGAPLLVEALSFYHPKVRAAALTSLGLVGTPESIAPILNVLGDGKTRWTVRERALWALGQLQAYNGAPLVMLSLFHPEPEVRRRAGMVLGELEVAYALPALVDRLEDPEIAGDVAISLAHLGASETVEQLNWAAMSPALSYEQRRKVFWALGTIADHRSVAPIIALFPSADTRLVTLAIETAGRIGRVEAAPALLTMLEHEDDAIRALAEWALGKVTGQHFGDDYGDWEEWMQRQGLLKASP